MMKTRRQRLLAEGVDPRLAARDVPRILRTSDGKNCRDREPWGGVTDPDRCSCTGRCQADEERARE